MPEKASKQADLFSGIFAEFAEFVFPEIMRAELEQTHQCRKHSYVERGADINLLKVFIPRYISLATNPNFIAYVQLIRLRKSKATNTTTGGRFLVNATAISHKVFWTTKRSTHPRTRPGIHFSR